MTIGIDLSPLQGPHRMRGIGFTLLNFINNISAEDRAAHKFIFYLYPETQDETLALLQLEGFSYITRPLRHRRRVARQLPGRLNLFVSALNQLISLRDLYFGDSRVTDTSDVDVYLQCDQSEHLPRRRHGLKTALVLYDLIPYVLESDYLWSYGTARDKGYSRKAAWRVQARRSLYATKIKASSRRANILLAISNTTKRDFVQFLHTPASKIVVTPLGVSSPTTHKSGDQPQLHRYVKNSWGYMQHPFSLDADEPFLLYVGGADRRRKLEDLVTAFNHCRAQGIKLKLVLAGDSMQGPDNIATEEIQGALKTSSYLADILFVGFIDVETRDWLYKHALAFVFPSRYEGFGLPVLEAMSYGTRVITYDNEAVREVAGDIPIYAHDAISLKEEITALLSDKPAEIKTLESDALQRAQQYTWHETSRRIIEALS